MDLEVIDFGLKPDLEGLLSQIEEKCAEADAESPVQQFGQSALFQSKLETDQLML